MSRKFLWPASALFLSVVLLMAAIPPPYDLTSAQDGDWQANSTWNEAGSPACNTSSRILIDGDTVTATCDIELSGSGVIVIRNEGYLKVQGGLTVTGQAELTVEDDAGMRVEGDLTVGGNGDLTINGSTDVTGNLEMNGEKATADGSGTLNLGGTGCTHFTGSGDCNGNAPLPVELVEFKAEAVANGIRLNWVTATEKRNAHFLVQRSSNGVEFQTLEKIPGQGTSVNRHSYEFLDEVAPKGDPYYRLIQVDRDGEETQYGPRTAHYEPDKEAADCEMKIVPNPCSGNCKVRFEGDCEGSVGEGKMRVRLYDIAGNRVHANMARGGSFSSEFFIDTDERLSPGIYVVRAVNKEGTVASEKMKKE